MRRLDPAPGGVSSLHHRHTRQDEFVYVLDGEPTLVTDEGSYPADDIQAVVGEDGKWRFAHKDGTPY